MKKIGFLSFGHWTASSQSQTRSAADTLLQSIDLAVAAEELGADGAFFRVHHFARQLATPFPLPAAIRTRTDTAGFASASFALWLGCPLVVAADAGAGPLTRPARLELRSGPG